MISDFLYSQPVKIFFGAGKFAGLHDVLSELGLHRCVVVCGRHFAPKAEELVSSMDELCTVFGGVDAPYIWMKTPDGMASWDFFDLLLNRYHVVGTPGAGFGPCGEGYFRLTAFNTLEKTQEAVERIIKG